MTKGNQGRFLLLYGSQTGQAKAIAEEIYEIAPNHGLQPELHCLSMTDKKFSIERETCMVMVVSTTGDGEPPDTASKFWRRLKKKTLPSDHLANLNYALLGLGDSNYNNFCRNPKNFEQRFEELGAKQFYPTGFADDAVGLEVIVEPWIDGLWPVLCKHIGLPVSACATNDEINSSDNCASSITMDSRINGNCASYDTADLAGSTHKSAVTDSTDGRDRRSENEDSDSGTDVDNPYGKTNSHKRGGGERTSTDMSAGSDITGTSAGKASAAGSGISNKEDRTGASRSTLESARTKVNNDGKPSTDKRPETSADGTDSGTSSGKEESSRTLRSKENCPSLTCSVPPLSESGLTLPLLPPAYLEVQFQKEVVMNVDQLSPQGTVSYPSAQSDISMATIVSATKLTRDDAVKTALDVELDISTYPFTYQPGDAFSIICPNQSAEVDVLIQRLGLSKQADSVFSLQLIANTKKRRAAVPEYIPQPCTVKHALTHCCDIRTPPKKAFLRLLVEYTDDEDEKRRLQELCSKQGTSDYGTYIREACVSILDILLAFPSCNPPLERLLEHLPRLLPRPYSITSSPLVNPSRLHFVFNIIEFPHSNGRAMTRQGVCTGWLNHKTQMMQQCISTEVKGHEGSKDANGQDIEGDMAALSISQDNRVLIFARSNTHFRLPEDPSIPIIMIGPGTGVAPFIGFLEHRQMQLKGDEDIKFGPSWLFFGCRHKECDFLYRHKLEHFVDSGVLSKLSVSFSRDATTTNDTSTPKYVQDNLRLHGTEVLDLLLEKNAILYVCGDAKNMARNVNETLLELIGKHTGKSAYDSTLVLAKLREEKRYREDIWT